MAASSAAEAAWSQRSFPETTKVTINAAGIRYLASQYNTAQAATTKTFRCKATSFIIVYLLSVYTMSLRVKAGKQNKQKYRITITATSWVSSSS